MLKNLGLVAVLAGIAFAVPVAAQQAPVAAGSRAAHADWQDRSAGLQLRGHHRDCDNPAGLQGRPAQPPRHRPAQVLEGEFMIQFDGKPEQTFKAGQSLEVPNQAIHNEGAVGSVPAKLIAVYVVEKGKPLVNPIK